MTDVTQLEAATALIERIQIEVDSLGAADNGINIAALTKAFENLYDVDLFADTLQLEITSVIQDLLNVIEAAAESVIEVDGISIAALTKAWAVLTAINESISDGARVSFHGTGDISVVAGKATHAVLSLTGSGDINISANIDGEAQEYAELSLTGTGDISVTAGLTAKAALSLTGSGDIAAQASKFLTASANINGTGDIAAQAILTAQAAFSLAGAGDIAIDATRIPASVDYLTDDEGNYLLDEDGNRFIVE